MSIPIAPTPILEVKNAKRFDRLVKQGLKNTVKFVPTPGLEEVKKKIAKESEVDWKKAFEMLYNLALKIDLDGIECMNCPAEHSTDCTRNCSEAIRITILKQCTKGGE
jgi:hypothetical protein